jgi:hypothetical protein
VSMLSCVIATPASPGLANTVASAVLNARYDLPRQVQMQLPDDRCRSQVQNR